MYVNKPKNNSITKAIAIALYNYLAVYLTMSGYNIYANCVLIAFANHHLLLEATVKAMIVQSREIALTRIHMSHVLDV